MSRCQILNRKSQYLWTKVNTIFISSPKISPELLDQCSTIFTIPGIRVEPIFQGKVHLKTLRFWEPVDIQQPINFQLFPLSVLQRHGSLLLTLQRKDQNFQHLLPVDAIEEPITQTDLIPHQFNRNAIQPSTRWSGWLESQEERPSLA